MQKDLRAISKLNLPGSLVPRTRSASQMPPTAWVGVMTSDCAGDEVIISAHNAGDCLFLIVIAGARPFPVDIGDDNLIDVRAVADAVGPRTVGGDADTTLNGRTDDMAGITDILSGTVWY